MVILKKIKASTLMETLVATVLILVIFILASMILNNVFSNTIKINTKAVNTYFKELQYLNKNKKLPLPFYDDFKTWEITIENHKVNQKNVVVFEAIESLSHRTIKKAFHDY
ncbi:hypothetical protein [uncultured Algibacter sp.]|uniref:hypothetical protein n=1 Tax=uncultured Algibacter sp. TaxID=298659 RepID=UPI002610707E|nr:hypothetical protein [uncultured Algibacter sp.]